MVRTTQPSLSCSPHDVDQQFDPSRGESDNDALAGQTTRTNTIHEHFDRQALQAGDAVAIRHDDDACTYTELRTSSNRLAHHLVTLGVTPGTPVGVCLPLGAELATVYLGVLKAGGLIVPMEPELPSERLNWMVQHTGAPVVLTDRRCAQLLQCDATILEAETLNETLQGLPIDAPAVCVPDDAAAYVLYTSGSTGEPKGVIGLHSATVNRLRWGWDAWPYQPGETSAWKTSIAFIDSFTELLAPLLAGVPTVVVSRATLLDPPRFLDLLSTQRISRLTLVPTYLRELLAWMAIDGVRLPALRVCTSSGEALTADLARRFFEGCPDATLLNIYGSTEVAGDVTSHAVRRRDIDGLQDAVPIGRPIANVRVHVFDDAQQPVKDGEVGELYVGGMALAEGYIHAPELSSERFLDTPDGRLFRTGDRVRRLPGGVLECLGRVDRQVKIRGVRVELGEVEARISQAPGVEHVAVVVDDGLLVAYVVGSGASAVLDHVQRYLPSEMVPARVVGLDALPLTASGKVDRKRLPAAAGMHGTTGAQPSSELERVIAQAWREALGHEKFDVDTTYSQAGGDSLSVVRLAVVLTESLGREVTSPQVLERPTIRAYAAWLEAGAAEIEKSAIIERMKADAVLDPDLTPPTPPLDGPPRHVLMTGATGFLGAHLLAELLESGVETVSCLVRPPLSRVAANLRHYGQWRESYAGRVHEIAGDLSRPRLGLSVEDYRRLAEDVDTIWNVGASVDIINAYDHHRPNNVGGATEIIRFACSQQTKRLHHISSVVAIETPGGCGKLVEEDHAPPLEDPGFVGYAHTKQVAEALVREAGTRGLPVNIYRCDNIAGSSQTGVSNPNDYFWRLFSGCVRLGEVPDLEYSTRMVPADRAAKALVKLGVRGLPGQTFHITSSSLVPSSTVIGWLEARGASLRRVPFAEWKTKMKTLPETDPDNPLAPMAWTFVLPNTDDLSWQELYTIGIRPEFSTLQAIETLGDPSLLRPIEQEEYDRCLDALFPPRKTDIERRGA